MEPYTLQFDPEAFGTPQDWNASAASVTWNRRVLFTMRQDLFLLRRQQALRTFTGFWIHVVAKQVFLSRADLHRRRRWNLSGSGSLGCPQEAMLS